MSNILSLIKHDEIIAEMASERCHHFTKGQCQACYNEEKAAKYSRKLASLSEALDEEYEVNGYSQAWETMLNEYNQLELDYMELNS